jgi:plasmid stabilization system protein ParE
MRLEILEAAAQAIVEQADYYLLKSGSTLGQRWESAVDEAILRLLRLPETGAPVRFRSPRLAGIRWVPVPGFPKHLIFYRYFPEQELLRVIHVLHGARDLEALLDPNS